MPEGTVIRQTRRGYRLKERLLRERARRAGSEHQAHVRHEVRARIPGRIVSVMVAQGDIVTVHLENNSGKVHPIVEEALARGLKTDVGHGSHFSYRMARIALDANQRWDVADSIDWVRRLAPHGLRWIEEPTSPDDILGMATIARAIAPIHTMADGDTMFALATGTRFIMAGANHLNIGVSTFPFTIFGGLWGEKTLDIALGAPSRGDTVVGNDVWIGYQSLIMPGVHIGNGAIIASGSVVVSDVPAYGVVGGNPARLLKKRYSDAEIELLERIAWWDWPVEKVTEHVRVIMSGTPAELAELA